MNIRELKGREKLLQMAEEHKLLERNSGVLLYFIMTFL
jgi:hypothetical protein